MAEKKLPADRGKAAAKPNHLRPTFRGLKPELGTLHYNPRENMSLNLNNFFEKMRTYVKANYYPDLDNIFNIVDAELPAVAPAALDPALPDEIARIRFASDYKMQRSKEERLADDMKKVHGIIEGQLTNASKEQLKTTAQGVAALENKNPLDLVLQLRSTHLLVDRTQPNMNYETANNNYVNIQGSDREPLSSYKRRLEAALAQLGDSAGRAGPEYMDRLPTAEMVVTRFIKGLAPKYGAYVRKIDRNEREMPANLQAAYDDVISHGEEYDSHRPAARNYGIFYTGRGYGDAGGRGRGGRGHQGRGNNRGDDEPVPGLDGKLYPHVRCNGNGCHRKGHYMRSCPLKAAKKVNQSDGDAHGDDAVANAVKTARGAAK